MNKIIAIGAAGVLAVVSYFVGGATISDAGKIATDTAAAKAYCEKLLDGTADLKEKSE